MRAIAPATPLAPGLTRRSLLRALGTGAGAATLAACGVSGGSGSGGSGGGSSKEFTFSSWSQGETATKDVINALVADFAASSGSSVKPATYPYNDFATQVLLRARSGSVSGAGQAGIDTLSSFAAAGVLVDLTAVAAKHDYTSAGLTSCQYQGRQYALPWTVDSIGLMGNKDLLAKAGVTTMPTTIEEFEAALVALKSLGGVTPYAASTKDPSLKDVIPWMWTYGATLVKDGRVTVAEDAAVKALAWYKSLVSRKLVALDVARTDARVLFARGSAGFYDDAVQAPSFLKTTPGGDKVAAVTQPIARPVLEAGDTPRALSHGYGIMVFNGKGSDAATAFAEYLTADPAALQRYVTAASLPPATTSGLRSPAFKANTFQSGWAEAITTTATSDPFWVYPKGTAIERALTDAIATVLTGGAKPKDALASAQRQMQALIGG